jgi:hypothetical protein
MFRMNGNLASIPYVGPALGAAAAGQAEAACQAYSVAEQGYDVPMGVNPITQLHAREMVLPANLASLKPDIALS